MDQGLPSVTVALATVKEAASGRRAKGSLALMVSCLSGVLWGGGDAADGGPPWRRQEAT